MIWVFLILAIVCILIIQIRLAGRSQEHIAYIYSYDNYLAEPGQVITLQSQLKNTWKLPILYIRLLEYYPELVRIEEPETWTRKYLKVEYSEMHTNYRLYLMPHTAFKTQFHFSLPKRGIYTIGRYYIETGDFLGFKTKYRTETMDKSIVIMPKRDESVAVMQALGGFIGDVSVRRFILEDPVLTIGFREYTERDPFKNISWNQTARTGKMQVKQFDYTIDADVSVVLNMEDGTPDDIESCLEITRTCCEELEKHHIPFEFCSNGDVSGPDNRLTWIPEGLGKQHMSQIMYGLGRSHCVNLSSFAALVDLCSEKRKSGKSIILITPPLSAANKKQCAILRNYSEQELCILTGSSGEKKEGAV